MKNILKYIVLSIVIFGTILSCGDRYEIDSQTDGLVRTLTVTSDSVYYFEATNTRDVILSINSSGAWSATCSEDWCSVDPVSSDESSLITEITLSIEENTDSYDERSAILTFSAENIEESKVIEIVQYGMVHLVVDSLTEAFAEEGSTQSFTVLCNRDFIVSASADWLSINPETGLASDEEQAISVTAESNSGQEKRSASIVVKTSDTETEFLVWQSGVGFEIAGEREFEIPAAGGSVTSSLESTTTWEVIIPEDCDWLSANSLSGSGNGDVVFTADQNPAPMPRSTYVYFNTPLESLNDSILISQETDAILFTEENFEANSWITFNDDGSATLYAGPGTGSRYMKSKINDFSYGKYTVYFSDIQIGYTATTMQMCITTEDNFNGGLSMGTIGKDSYSDDWAFEYWISDDFGSLKRQREDNDILRDDIVSYTIDVRKSADEGKVDIDFYINDILLASKQGNDGFASGNPFILSFWIYNYYDKENAAVFEPHSLVYEPYDLTE